jgi:transcription termination factor Rho
MSVGSQALERSALESKDRESLQQIATAMGGKPGSRAKKADIIDMILELAGVTSAADSSTHAPEAPAAEAAPSTRRRSPRRSGGETADEGSADPGSGADGEQLALTDAGGDESSTGSARDTTEAAASGEAAADESATGSTTTATTATAATADAEAPAARTGEDTDRQPERRGADEHDDSGAGNGHAPAAQQGAREDGETGNRRRRRRGRDRNRDGGQGQGQGQGQGDQPEQFVGEPVDVAGLLDLRDEGYGFLRVNGYLPSKDDVYVSVKQVRQFGLRKGDHLKGASRPASRNEKNPALLRIDEVNGQDPESGRGRPRFEDLTPLYPDERLKLESKERPYDMNARIIDLVSPIGKGQRGLIVSPPKAGKTTVMKSIATAIELNNPEVHLIVLLVDERPEEVTDMRRTVKGEVIASTFDRPAEEHTMVTELAIERAKRIVEDGKDVVIILDGITRLARAYNLAAPATGRIMSGGIDTGALYPPKKFFGAARNVEEGGSLTILATALVETGSKMDEVIFEEFKGTGNMELRLDRRLAERRIYPAIDVDGSSTRHEELLFDRKQLNQVWKLRRVLSGLASEGNSGAGLEMLVDRLQTFKTNDDFLAELAKAPAGL